jgi:hypothetical protein
MKANMFYTSARLGWARLGPARPHCLARLGAARLSCLAAAGPGSFRLGSAWRNTGRSGLGWNGSARLGLAGPGLAMLGLPRLAVCQQLSPGPAMLLG